MPKPSLARPGTNRGDCRLSISQDDRKRRCRGYDGPKKPSGRKRHLLVHTGGLVLRAVAHPANVADRDGVRAVLEPLPEMFPSAYS